MFKDYINSPIDPISIEYVNSIRRLNNEPDYSLTCLGVAMLKPRIENYKGVTGVYNRYQTKDACILDFVDRTHEENETPVFCYYRYTDSEFEQKVINDNLSEFKERNSISAFIKDKMEVECLVLYHETRNIVGIFVNANDIRLYHLLLSFFSLYYPSIFKEKPLSESELAFVSSLSNKSSTKFFENIRILIEPYRVEFKRLQIESFMKALHDDKIQAASEAVNNQKYTVEDAESRFSEAVRRWRELIVTLEGLKATESYDEAEKDFTDYISTSKDIYNLSFRDRSIYFCVKTLLNNYNENAWQVFSERGGIFDGEYGTRLSEPFNTTENRKLLLNNIFSEDPVFHVRMCGNYRLDVANYRSYCDSSYNYTDVDSTFENYMPNPHIRLHSCLGAYKDQLMNALVERNYIGAAELCVASAGSVNIDETTQTFRPFLGQLLNNKHKVLVDNEGNEYTPEEALAWLKENKNEAT